jgi:hypothetical protein
MWLEYPRIDHYGRIIWRFQKKPIQEKLLAHRIARLDKYADAFITQPLTVESVRKTAVFARDLDIKIEPHEELGLSVDHPEALVAYFYLQRIEMSLADTPFEKVARYTRQPLSPFIEAAVLYAIHTQRCFIADPEESDRQIAALASINLLKGYPCALVCREQERDMWTRLIKTYLPEDIQILNGRLIESSPAARSIWLFDYHDLERDVSLPRIAPKGIIVDHAHFIKNPQANRTQLTAYLARGARYRFLVTDFPVNLSPSDLREPLEILGKTQEFNEMVDFLNQVDTDPLENREALRSNTEYHARLTKLFRQLRCTCLVRRANEPGLRSHEHIHPIELKPIPARINMDDVLSDLRLLGLQKTEQAVAWLRRFLPQNSGKVLIFAHHNDVVEELAAALNLPAIYGKVTDDEERSAIAAQFIHPDGPQALIVASDVELTWNLAPVTALVFVELWITPRQLYGFVDHILGQDETRTLPVHLLHVKESLDDDALERLGLRLTDYDLTMDGVQPKK